MKARIFEEKCIGCGQCEAVCNKVFNIGDEGYAEVVCEEIPKELVDDATMAAEGCPTGAIEIKENFECNCNEKCDKTTECNCDEKCTCDKTTECNCEKNAE